MESNDPLKLFHHYWEEAKKLKDPDADSVSLATVDAKNRPHVRTVLLKTFRKGVRERSEREGEAPTALPLEGALPAPAIGFVTREGGEKIAQIKHCNDVEC
ncbi:MAG: hypothetical protein HY877_07440, partial [Deltaproteobacteria bacterium]|nr:hypothetical protein [Deltaproteobacteria bacterium]